MKYIMLYGLAVPLLFGLCILLIAAKVWPLLLILLAIGLLCLVGRR